MRVKLLIIGHLGGGAQTVARGPAEGQKPPCGGPLKHQNVTQSSFSLWSPLHHWKKDNTLLKLALDSVRESIFLLAALTETKHRKLQDRNIPASSPIYSSHPLACKHVYWFHAKNCEIPPIGNVHRC